MSILVGGGTGFIGRQFIKYGASKGYNIISVSRTAGPGRITWKDVSRNGLPADCFAVVSLSGEPVLQPFKRWNDDMKEMLRSSRIEKTQLLSRVIAEAAKPPAVFLSLSGVGIYRPDKSREYTEEDRVESFDFLSKLSRDWETAAVLPDSVSTRTVIIRTGVVLGKDGGMIKSIKAPFYFGLGGPIGSGEQWLPWIHVEDMAGIMWHAIQHEGVTGILNGTAPNPVLSRDFTKAYASALWRPHLFPLPSFVVNTVFGSEAGMVMLQGQKVLPVRTLESGYSFKYPDIVSACKELAS